MGKPKQKISIEELLEGINASKTNEFMNPVKPFKRQLHIELVSFKDDKVREKLAIKKGHIAKLIVDFNSANREVLKVKALKGQLKVLYEWLRIKDYCRKYSVNSIDINRRLNLHFPECIIDGQNGDYHRLHERVFYIMKRHATNNHFVAGVLGINFRNQIDSEGQIAKFAGDITLLKIVDAKSANDILRLIPQKFNQLSIIRIIHAGKGTAKMLSDYIDVVFRNKWYYSRGIPKGYYPLSILKNHRCRIRGNLVTLTDEFKRLYKQPPRRRRTSSTPSGRIGIRARGRSIVSDMVMVREQVIADLDVRLTEIADGMRDEGYDEEIISDELDGMVEREVESRMEPRGQEREAENRVSDVGTSTVEQITEIAGLLRLLRRRITEYEITSGSEVETQLRTLASNMRDNGYSSGAIATMYSNIRSLYRQVYADSRTEDEGRLPVGTRIVIEHGNRCDRAGLNDGRQECKIIEIASSSSLYSHRCEFPNGSSWWIQRAEIVEVTERMERLPVGTRIVIRRGNEFGRQGLNTVEQECRIIVHLHGHFDYKCEFPNGMSWNIKAEEIIRILEWSD